MTSIDFKDNFFDKGYSIGDELGRGGIGITYQAEQLKLSQQVAIKVLSLHQISEWKVLELFEREAKVLANLQHPQIPKYIESFTFDTKTDKYFCLVQELAIGESLENLYQKAWRPDESELKNIAIQLLEILIYLHQLNPPVIHRDIKPANIIYQPDLDKVFLVDFGAVQDTYRNTFTRGGTFVGTMGFMAPEQYSGEVSFATDLYGVGATLVYLITGMNPADLPQKRMRLDWRRLAYIEVSEKFGNWLDSLLEAVPEDRAADTNSSLAVLRGDRESVFSLISLPPFNPKLEWKVIKNRDRFEADSKLKYNFMEFFLASNPETTYFFLYLVMAFLLPKIFTLFNAKEAERFEQLIISVISLVVDNLPLTIFTTLIIFVFCIWRSFEKRKTNFRIIIDREYFKLFYNREQPIFCCKTEQISDVIVTKSQGPGSRAAPGEMYDNLSIFYGAKRYEFNNKRFTEIAKCEIIWLVEEIRHFLGFDLQEKDTK